MAKRNKIDKISALNIIIKILLSVTVIAAIFVFLQNDNALADMYILNRKPIIVQTDTMEPVIKDGSLVVVKKAKIEDLRDMDVIAYRLDDRIIIHRAFIGEDGVLKTKADTSSRFDLYEINDDNLIGYVSLRVNVPVFKFLDHIEVNDGISVEDVDI